jgi:hypothetical protein
MPHSEVSRDMRLFPKEKGADLSARALILLS